MQRRTILTGAAAALLTPAGLATPAIAQDTRAATLRFVPQANLSVLDPIWTTATVTSAHGYYVFDTLYSLDSAMRSQPQMAQGHEVSADQRVWTIKLRDGLKFHDTTPVRAVDCIASLKRWSQKEPFGQILAKVIDKYVAVDDRTFSIYLTRPFPLLLDAIGKADASIAFIMPERLAVTDPNTQITEMIGSGPYRFIPKEFNSGSRAVYEKFDDYVPRAEPPNWASGGKVAHFKRIEWQIIPDPATAGAALQNGEVDWWENPLNDLLPSLAKNPNITLQVTDPGGKMALARLNHLQPPFNNAAVRRAVLMAINQEDYMRAAIGDDETMWSISRSLFPKGTPYYRDIGATLMPNNIDAAKAALAKSGYAGEKVVIINPGDYPTIGALGQVTDALLRQIGMNVELQTMDWGSVVQHRTNRDTTDKGGWSIFHTTGTVAGYSNPAVSAIVRGQGTKGWFGWWDSPKGEALAQEWLDAPDAAGQARAAEALNQLALEEVATVPLGVFTMKTAFRKRITGVLQGVSAYPWNVRPV